MPICCDTCLGHGEFLLHGLIASRQVPPVPTVAGAKNDTGAIGPLPTTQCDEESKLESLIDSFLPIKRFPTYTIYISELIICQEEKMKDDVKNLNEYL